MGFEITNFGGLICLCSDNNGLKTVVSIGVGPRILYFGKTKNLLHTERKLFVNHRQDKHVPYGGHRLWIAPECEKSYDRDNDPVIYGVDVSSCLPEFSQHLDKPTGGAFCWLLHDDKLSSVQKLMAISETESGLRIEHLVKYYGKQKRELSLWSITQMKLGGFVVMPQSAEKTGLLYNRVLSAWEYTDLTDERAYLGKRFVTVSGMPRAGWDALKLGLNATSGKIAYVLGSEAVVFSTNYAAGAKYPDGGCNAECYACNRFIEAEMLSPLYTLGSGDMAKFTVELTYKSGVAAAPKNENSLELLFE